MRSLIAAYADAIIAIATVLFILLATLNVVAVFQTSASVGLSGYHPRRSVVIISAYLFFIAIFAYVYVAASDYASPRMQALFGFATAYGSIVCIVWDKAKIRRRKLPVYVAVCVVVLSIAAVVVFLTP